MSARSRNLVDFLPADVFTPREYQVELFEHAKHHNIIVALGTGSGKTFIAIMLIKEMSVEIRRSWDDGGRRTFFLVNNVPLVSQQADAIERHCDLSVGRYVGSQTLDIFTSADWQAQFRQHQVLVMSSQIFLDILLQGHLSVDRINLVIFDECHHAVKDNPMRLICRRLVDEVEGNAAPQPRVLGLSASIINRKVTPVSLERAIHQLETTLGCSVRTSSDLLSVLRHCTDPTEKLVQCADYQPNCQLHGQLSAVVDQCLGFLRCHRYAPIELYGEEYEEFLAGVPDPIKDPKQILLDLSHILTRLGPWCADRAAYYLMIEVERLRRKTAYDRHYLLLGAVFSSLVVIRQLCRRQFDGLSLMQQVERFSAPKVVRLLLLLKFLCSDDEQRRGLCAIVFVKQRITAKTLFRLLKEVSADSSTYSFVRPHFLMGSNQDAYFDPSLRRKQEEVLRKFRVGERNLLVSTSILEEGVDVPRCNLVVRFDPPGEFRSYVQSKGRARAARAFYLLMATESELPRLLNDLSTYHIIEKKLKQRSCSDNIEEPTLTEQQHALYDNIIEPFRPAVDSGAMVTRNSAISLINRYCSKLPSDNFTRLAPHWTVKRHRHTATDTHQRADQQMHDCSFVCHLRLPINSPCRQVFQSDEMPFRRLARQSAALKACRMLHEIGELDDHLLPLGKEAFVERLCVDNDDQTDAGRRPGSTKRRQYYRKLTSEYLQCGDTAITDMSADDGASASFHLYRLAMRLTCSVPDDHNVRARRIFRPQHYAPSLGLITVHRLPQLCAFPVFTRSGEVEVELQLVCSHVKLSGGELRRLVRFHQYVFCGVLRVHRFPMHFSFEQSGCGYLVIPLIGETANSADRIDWPFLDALEPRYTELPTVQSEAKRQTHETRSFTREQLHDAVVMPWYRNTDEPQFFYVAEVLEHLNPDSDFPDGPFTTFSEYYHSKYGVRIINKRQPLVDVDHTSVRLNLLTPRYVNRKGVALPLASVDTKRAKREQLQQKQILVPELCCVHPLSASFWRKLVTLPTVLYRLNCLLLAYSLRQRVALDMKLGVAQPDSCWTPMNFGWVMADVLDKRRVANNSGASSGKSSKRLSMSKTSSVDEPVFHIGTWDGSVEGAGDTVSAAGMPNIERTLDDNCQKLPQLLPDVDEVDEEEEMATAALPADVTMLADVDAVRYGSPSFLTAGWRETVELAAHHSSCSEQEDSQLSSEPEDEDAAPTTSPPVKSQASPISSSRRSCPPASGYRLADDEPQDDTDDEQAFNFIDGSVSLQQVEQKMNQLVKDHSSRIKKVMLVESLSDLRSSRVISPVDPSLTVSPAGAAECSSDTFGSASSSPHSSAKTSPAADSTTSPGQFTTTTKPSNSVRAPDYQFDWRPPLHELTEPAPALLLQALTMSNANDGVNLERLETIGDSFLKFSVTTYLYVTYPNVHEGRLSYMRSKRVSNANLYRLASARRLGDLMVASQFEPRDNWLPPGFIIPDGLEEEIICSGVPASHINSLQLSQIQQSRGAEGVRDAVREHCRQVKKCGIQAEPSECGDNGAKAQHSSPQPSFVPYNLITQQSIPDKSVADCAEALIGAYLTSCGPRAALVFISWLGLKVLPSVDPAVDDEGEDDNELLRRHRRARAATRLAALSPGMSLADWQQPPSPLLETVARPRQAMNALLAGLDQLEDIIGYTFSDKSYLVQAFTHSSYTRNSVTDCYQRLEFLGDAVLDYLVTRHLFEDGRNHDPGTLTDLRSALVNNAIFATLAVRFQLHRFFMHYSPGMTDVLDKFLKARGCDNTSTHIDQFLLDAGNEDEEDDDAEDVEMPKTLGDLFESLAGAVFMDSGMSLDRVWAVFYPMMKREIEEFSNNIPMSPIRELLEMEPETAKFRKPERCVDGKVRVTVDVFGKGVFSGVGRNCRVAKRTAAKRALRALRRGSRRHAQHVHNIFYD